MLAGKGKQEQLKKFYVGQGTEYSVTQDVLYADHTADFWYGYDTAGLLNDSANIPKELLLWCG